MQSLHLFLDESNCKDALFPFAQIRHAADFVVGIYSIKERWQNLVPNINIVSEHTEDALSLPANVIPTTRNVDMLLNAAKERISLIDSPLVPVLHHPSDVFHHFKTFLEEDIFNEIAGGKTGTTDFIEIQPLVFAHPTAIIKSVFFDTDNGPILIDADVRIGNGAMLAGPIYLGKESVVKMGAKLYGPLSIAKKCTIGGELSNSIFYAESNKGHEGYVGTSIIGACCNMGAGASCSNVKNTAGKVKYELGNGEFYNTQSIKAGLLMGDYSRCAINTSFNTAAVVGISCNIFGASEPKRFYNNFTWGREKYDLDKAIEHISNWKDIKGEQVTEGEIKLIKELYK